MDKRTKNILYVRLDLVGGILDKVEIMQGRTRLRQTRHGAKLAATSAIMLLNLHCNIVAQTFAQKTCVVCTTWPLYANAFILNSF